MHPVPYYGVKGDQGFRSGRRISPQFRPNTDVVADQGFFAWFADGSRAILIIQLYFSMDGDVYIGGVVSNSILRDQSNMPGKG